MSVIIRRLATSCGSVLTNTGFREALPLASLFIKNDQAFHRGRQLHSSTLLPQRHAGDQKLAEEHDPHEVHKLEQLPTLRSYINSEQVPIVASFSCLIMLSFLK